MALALRWHHTPAWACVDSRPTGPWHSPFVLRLSLNSSLIAHHCCLEWKNLFLGGKSSFQKNDSLDPIGHGEGHLLSGFARSSLVSPNDVWQLFQLFPFASSNLFLSPLTMTLLTASACPFPYGYAEVEYLFFMPRSQQYLWKTLLSNWSPLSEISVWGIPNRVTIFFQTNVLASTSLIFANGSASTHLVK